MAYTKKLQYDVLRSINSATFTGSYQAIGTPLTYPTSLVRLVNNSSVSVTISTDGVNDNELVPLNSFVLYDVTANTPANGDDAIFIPKGTQFYAKAAAGVGFFYIVSLYIVQV